MTQNKCQFHSVKNCNKCLKRRFISFFASCLFIAMNERFDWFFCLEKLLTSTLFFHFSVNKLVFIFRYLLLLLSTLIISLPCTQITTTHTVCNFFSHSQVSPPFKAPTVFISKFFGTVLSVGRINIPHSAERVVRDGCAFQNSTFSSNCIRVVLACDSEEWTM